MKISTGLRPESKAWKVPVGVKEVVYDSPFVGRVAVPLSSLEVQTVWIVEFWDAEDLEHSPMGRHHHTMIVTTEPKIEKRGFRYGITDEHRAKAEVDARYRRDYDAPDDAQKVVKHYGPTQQTDVTYNWYEVTL